MCIKTIIKAKIQLCCKSEKEEYPAGEGGNFSKSEDESVLNLENWDVSCKVSLVKNVSPVKHNECSAKQI